MDFDTKGERMTDPLYDDATEIECRARDATIAQLRAQVRTPECVFCEVIAGRALGVMPTRWDDAVVIEPLNPVTPGHVLIVPRQHVRDAAENQRITAATMRRVAQYLQLGSYPDASPVGPANVITSCGPEATQTVMHLHVHVVPRRAGDGLMLPWSAVEVDLKDLIDARLSAEVATLTERAERAEAALLDRKQVGWLGPYGIVPGGMDAHPGSTWLPVYVLTPTPPEPT